MEAIHRGPYGRLCSARCRSIRPVRSLKSPDVRFLRRAIHKETVRGINFHRLAAERFQGTRKETLWFMKAPTSLARQPAVERRRNYAERSSMKAEIGVVSARMLQHLRRRSGDSIFRLQRLNDCHRGRPVAQDKSFEQWARSKDSNCGCVWSVHRHRLDPRSCRSRPSERQERRTYPGATKCYSSRTKRVAALQGRHTDAGRHHRLRHLARRTVRWAMPHIIRCRHR